MKKMNRREFLALTGAAVVALSLAGCDDEPYAPPAPPAPTTSKEAKVLEALNLYRKKAGVKEPLVLDSGLDHAAEIAVEVAKGGEFMTFMNEYTTLQKHYIGIQKPIGVRIDNDGTHVTPVCVYSDNAEEMALNLDIQLDETDKANLTAIKLVNIKTFEYSGTTYWLALIAEGKK